MAGYLILLLLCWFGFAFAFRRALGKKRGWKCEYPRCKKTFYGGWMIEFHHKIPTSAGGSDKEENALLLCVYHHYVVHLMLAKMGIGHGESPRFIKARLDRTEGGRTDKWLETHGDGYAKSKIGG